MEGEVHCFCRGQYSLVMQNTPGHWTACQSQGKCTSQRPELRQVEQHTRHNGIVLSLVAVSSEGAVYTPS